MSKQLDLSKPLDQETINDLLQRHPVEKVQYLVELSQSDDFDDEGNDAVRKEKSQEELDLAAEIRQEEEDRLAEERRQAEQDRRDAEAESLRQQEDDSDDGSGRSSRK